MTLVAEVVFRHYPNWTMPWHLYGIDVPMAGGEGTLDAALALAVDEIECDDVEIIPYQQCTNQEAVDGPPGVYLRGRFDHLTGNSGVSGKS